MKTLLSGATGFLGRHLVEYLIKQKENSILGLTSRLVVKPYNSNNQINTITWNLLGPPDYRTKKIIDEFSPDMVIHTAALSSNKDCVNNWAKNGIMTENLLNNLPTITDIIYISSADVYSAGDLNNGAHLLSHIWPHNAYGLSKEIGEKLCFFKATETNFSKKTLIVRPIAFTGRYATHGLVYDVVKKLLSSSGTLKLFGEGQGSSKPVMYIDDVVNEIFIRYNTIHSYSMCNISNGDPQNVLTIANTIMTELEIFKDIEWVDNFSNDLNYINVLNSNHNFKSTLESVKLAAKEIYEEIKEKTNK